MTPDVSPFPPSWVGTGMEGVGLGSVRPDVGTYGLYDFALLPLAPRELSGDWGWLAAETECPDGIAVQGDHGAKATARAVQASAARVGVTLPPAFVKYINNPSLHRRIRSNTDCHLDICRELVPSPLGGGFLVRFLADSQGCVFWYLYVTPNPSEHAVVSSPGFYGTSDETERWVEEPPDPSSIAFAAESFEVFMWRFRLENEIWFAGVEDGPMFAAGAKYIEQYLARAGSVETGNAADTGV